MPRFFTVFVALIFSAGLGFSQAVPLKDGPPKDGPKKEAPKKQVEKLPKFFKLKPVEINVKDDELLKLQKERVNLLVESIFLEVQRVSIGTSNFYAFSEQAKQYLKAQLEITPVLDDQLTLFTDYHEATKYLHEQIKVRVESGFESKIGLLNWAAEVKWAEIEVLKLKRKIAAEKKKE